MKQPLRQTLVCGGTNRIDTEAYAYQPGKDGIPIYQTWDEYQDYDQGISGRKMQLLEIGWNISATSKAKSLKFEVTMTLVGATTLYSDVAKFQWEPVSELNETPIGKVTGTKTWLRSRQTAATLLSLAAKGAIAIYPGPASLYGGVELTGLAAKTRPLALQAVSQMLSGSGAADLALWDQYLVYATAMGMSKRTLRELAKAYPQIQNPDWLDDNATDSLVYWNFRYASIGDTHDGSSRASTGDGTGLGFGLGPADSDHLGASFGGILDFGAQLGSGFNEISATIQGAAPASASIDGSSGSFLRRWLRRRLVRRTVMGEYLSN